MSFFCKNLTHHLKYICCKRTSHTSCSLYSFKYETWSQKCVTRTQVVILSSFLRDSTRCFCQGSVLNLSSKLSFIHISSFTTLTATGKAILKVSEMWDWIYWISELFIKLHKIFDPLTTLEKTQGRDKYITYKEANQQRDMPLAACLYLSDVMLWSGESCNQWLKAKEISISPVVQDDELPSVLSTKDCLIGILGLVRWSVQKAKRATD